MEVRKYLELFRRRWLSVLLVTLASVAIAGALTASQTPRYTATTRLFFSVEGGESASDLAQASTFIEQQMTSYAQVAISPLILDRVIAKLALSSSSSDLADTVTASAPADTAIMDISATDQSAEQAARIANLVGGELTSFVEGNSTPTRLRSGVRAITLAEALPPRSPSSPNAARNLGLGLLLGLLLGVGTGALRQALDTSISGERELQEFTGQAVLGVVPFDRAAQKHPVGTLREISGARSEAVRRLRTNLEFVGAPGETKSILVTSSIQNEGKTTTAINLALSFAEVGRRVVLVDADLRRPSIASLLKLDGAVGLTTVLTGQVGIDDAVQRWRETTMDVLTAGELPSNLSEILGTQAVSSLLRDLAVRYDAVVVDSPSLLSVTDAVILSKSVSGTLVVVDQDSTSRPKLLAALRTLTLVEANLLGVVINKIAPQNTSAFDYDSGALRRAVRRTRRRAGGLGPRPDNHRSIESGTAACP